MTEIRFSRLPYLAPFSFTSQLMQSSLPMKSRLVLFHSGCYHTGPVSSWSLIPLIPWCYQHPKVGKVNPKDARSLDRDSPAPEKIKVTLYPTIIWVNIFTHPDLSCTVQERVYRISFFPPFFLPSFHPSFHPSSNKYFRLSFNSGQTVILGILWSKTQVMIQLNI